MKKFLLILSVVMLTAVSVHAQDDGDDQKIRDKMREYIQKRMNLNRNEAEKFTPIFLRYFREWRQTLRTSKTLPILERQQKLLDLKLRYRTEFKDIVGEARSNEIYEHQERFIRELKTINDERIKNRPIRRNR